MSKSEDAARINKLLCEALQWLAEEMRSELTEDGASLPQWLVKSWLKRCDDAMLAAEQATGATPYTGGRAARRDIDPAEGVPVPLNHDAIHPYEVKP